MTTAETNRDNGKRRNGIYRKEQFRDGDSASPLESRRKAEAGT